MFSPYIQGFKDQGSRLKDSRALNPDLLTTKEEKNLIFKVWRMMKKVNGFTLIELLIVITVLNILAMASITAYTGVRLKALRQEAYTNLESLRLLIKQYYAEHGNYLSAGTCAKDKNNINAIQAILRGFNPGSGLNYSYCIEQNINLNGNSQSPCFRASAFGNSNTSVNGDVFRIDCNNNRNF